MESDCDSDVEYFDESEDYSDDDDFEPDVEESEYAETESDYDDGNLTDQELEEQLAASEPQSFMSKDKKIQYSADPLPYARPPASVSGVISNEGKL